MGGKKESISKIVKSMFRERYQILACQMQNEHVPFEWCAEEKKIIRGKGSGLQPRRLERNR